MNNEELILESLQELLASSSKTNEAVGSFAAFLAKRFPGLSKREQAMFLSRSVSLLADAKAQSKRIVKLEAALKVHRENGKNA